MACRTSPFLEGRLMVGAQASVVVRSAFWWNPAHIHVRPAERYQIHATGVWYDASIPSSPSGYASPRALFGAAEPFRRLPGANWFSLCAAVVEEDNLEEVKPGLIAFLLGSVWRRDRRSQIVRVGLCAGLETDRWGWLYFFANDLACMYGNNSGEITATVVRLQ